MANIRAMDSTIDELLANNRDFAARAPTARLDAQPSRSVAVVACMDARLDVHAALGLREGEAHVLRNAGGIVTDDVLRSLVVSQRRLGTREVMLLHHTRCGMQTLDEDELRAELAQAAGGAPSWAIGAFGDLDEDVRESIGRVRDCPFLPHRDRVRGFVYDVDTRLLREVQLAHGVAQAPPD
jgi:carbonic anhydrase